MARYRSTSFHPGWLLLLVACSLGTGCGRTDVSHLRVEGANSAGLARWRHTVSDRFTREGWRDFDTALQDLRLDLTAKGEASGQAAVDAALCARIAGKTLRDVLKLGAEARVQRLVQLRGELKSMIDGNALMVPRPGDAESARHLEKIRSAQQQRLGDLDAQLASARERHATLVGAADVSPLLADTTQPRKLPREEARAQIERLVASRREQAAFRHGPWPVKLDPAGTELSPEERADFNARRALATTNGHTVVAVRRKGRWWIHDAPIARPEFSPAVVANLTSADREELDRAWTAMAVEIWVRETAAKEENTPAGEK